MPKPFALGTSLGLSSIFARPRKSRARRGARHADSTKATPAATRAATEALESRLLLSRTWVVAPGGSDWGAGTLTQPLRTIQEAANVAAWSDTVLIRGGTYHESVRPASGGITFEAYPGESVTVSGANPIGNWAWSSGAVYRASMPWDLGEGSNQVFVDGQMMNEARWPNTSLDVSHPTLAHVGSYSGNVIYDSALTQPNGFWNGATIHITPGQQWVAYTGTVLASGPGWLQVSLPPLSGSEWPTSGNSFYLSGKYQALDSPGEWYRDNSGNLYLWDANSDYPGWHDVEVKARQFAFDLSGRSNITLEGINLFAATIKTDWGSPNLTIDHMTARYISQFNNIWNGWAPPMESGIELNGWGSVLENSNIGPSAGHGVYIGNSNVRVTNTVIHDVDYSATDAAAIYDTGSGTVLDHNNIYYAGRSGITHRVGNVKILYNTIHDIMLQATDGGGTYTSSTNGQGTEIAYNQIYNVTSGGWGSAAIFLDNNSSNFIVHDNTTWNVYTALKLNFSSHNEQVYNNKLGANSWSIEHNAYDNDWSGSAFYNNTFFAPVQWGWGMSAWSNAYAAGAPAAAPITPVATPAPTAPVTTPTAPAPAPAPAPASTALVPYDARGQWYADQYAYSSGTTRLGGGAIGSLDNGDYIQYNGVNFGSGVSNFTANVAVPAAYAGQKIQIHIDSLNGPLVGVLTTTATASWGSYTAQTTKVSAVTGIHNLFLVGSGWYGIGNVQWWKFS